MKFFDDDDIKYERIFDYCMISSVHNFELHQNNYTKKQYYTDTIGNYINNEYIIYLYDLYNIGCFDLRSENENLKGTKYSTFIVILIREVYSNTYDLFTLDSI